MCSVAVPELRKPCRRPGGMIKDCPGMTMMRSLSSHISASPSRTESTSSTGWQCGGVPMPGATHCSKMHSCAAPLTAETTMRVSTPGRQCSCGIDIGSLIFMEQALSHLGYRALAKQTDGFRARKTANHPNGGTAMALPSQPPLQKVALVTGAARGIGLATAKRFLAEGWRVALLDIEGALLLGAVESLADPDNTLALHCDVYDAGAVAAAMAGLSRRFGRLDALVNNAGIAVFAPLLETSNEDWNRVLAVNLTGPLLCTKAAAPLMREHGGGAVVNITSISAVRASTLRSAYGTSKAGLAHLTKQLAVELASLGIRVNGVAPGPVDTAMA